MPSKAIIEIFSLTKKPIVATSALKGNDFSSNRSSGYERERLYRTYNSLEADKQNLSAEVPSPRWRGERGPRRRAVDQRGRVRLPPGLPKRTTGAAPLRPRPPPSPIRALRSVPHHLLGVVRRD